MIQSMKIKQNEIFVYQAVMSGDLVIEPDGAIWRVRKRTWDSGQRKAVSTPCRRVRAENDCGDYLQVRVMVDGKRVCALAHRVVYHHFKGPIPDGLTVNHEDGNKKRNTPTNLELATYSEQQVHAIHTLKTARLGHQNGTLNLMAKLEPSQIATIRRRRAAGERLISIASDFGISFQEVSKIARGERWGRFPG